MAEGGGGTKKGFSNNEERKRAARELEDDEPPKKGRGEVISSLQRKLRRKEGWSLDKNATPPSSPKLQLAADPKGPQTEVNTADPKGPQSTNTTADPEGPQRETKKADPKGSPTRRARSADPKGPQPSTSTPKNIELVEKAVHTLNLSEKDATAEKISSDEEGNPCDGELEKVDTRSAKQLGRARRNRARRNRRKAEELELTKSGGPNAKKQRTEERNSRSETSSPDRTEDERPKRTDSVRPRFKPSGERQSFAQMVKKEDLVCSLVSDDATRALTPADFTHFNDLFITSLEENIDYKDIVKYSVKVGSMHDGYIRLCMESRVGVEYLKKMVPSFKPLEGRPRFYFVEPGIVPYEYYKCFVSNPRLTRKDGMTHFCRAIRGMNTDLIGGTINARIAKTVERKEEKDKGPFNVVIIRVSRDLVPIIHKKNYKLRYVVGELVLHRRVNPNEEIDDESETREMECESSPAATEAV